jgi:hypothetical protein
LIPSTGEDAFHMHIILRCHLLVQVAPWKRFLLINRPLKKIKSYTNPAMRAMCNNCIDNASIELVRIDATLETSLHKLGYANTPNLFAVYTIQVASNSMVELHWLLELFSIEIISAQPVKTSANAICEQMHQLKMYYEP